MQSQTGVWSTRPWVFEAGLLAGLGASRGRPTAGQPLWRVGFAGGFFWRGIEAPLDTTAPTRANRHNHSAVWNDRPHCTASEWTTNDSGVHKQIYLCGKLFRSPTNLLLQIDLARAWLRKRKFATVNRW